MRQRRRRGRLLSSRRGGAGAAGGGLGSQPPPRRVLAGAGPPPGRAPPGLRTGARRCNAERELGAGAGAAAGGAGLGAPGRLLPRSGRTPGLRGPQGFKGKHPRRQERVVPVAQPIIIRDAMWGNDGHDDKHHVIWYGGGKWDLGPCDIAELHEPGTASSV
ncbi:uncharacterized protein LOC107400885 [Peromyscus maniculatus bairdii]|uniref:uncharacterized protein LOC107400885 n=1 Tax=Peromyscus maniculatus bairdii TaxID=230844 RepID=UPI003FD6A4E3